MNEREYFAVVCRNIRAERARRRMTQADLADKLGITRACVSGLERNTHHLGPPLAMLLAICRILGISMHDLIPPYVPRMTSHEKKGAELHA